MSRSKGRLRRKDPDQFLDSKLFRFGTRVVIGIFVAVVFLTLAQCNIEKPEAPQWVTTMTVPVIDRNYPMSELVWRMDQDEVQIIGDSIIMFSFEQEMDTVQLDQENLAVPNIDTTVSQTLGAIDLDPPTISPVIVYLGDIVPLIASVPDTTMSIDNDMPTLASFSTASISSGGPYIVLSNNLAIDLDNVVVDLYDVAVPANPLLVASRSFSLPIPDGATDSVFVDLGGRTISNSLSVKTTFHTPGGSSLRLGAKELSTGVNFNGPLSISSATNAAVPSVTVGDTSLVELGSSGDTDVIHSATLSSGSLSLTITNNTNVDATLSIALPDLTYSGSPFSLQQPVAAHAFQTVNIDLAGSQVLPSDLSAPQEIELAIVAVTDSNRVDIDQSQSFSVAASLSSLTFSSVTGVFDSNTTTLTPSQHLIDIPQGFDGFELANAVLTLTLENSVQLAGSLDLTINGSNGNQLNVSGVVLPGLPGTPVTTIIVNSSAAAFLTPIPTSLSVSGSATFGDGVSVGTLNTSDYVFASVKIESPLEMIVNPTTIDLDVESEDIDAADVTLITDHVEELRFIYSFDNGLPLGLTANIYVAEGNNVSALVYDLDLTGLTVAAAPVGVDGRATGTTLVRDTLILTNSDLQFLNTDSIYIYTELNLAGSGGQTVRLLPDDAIRITGRLEVDYLFDSNF